MEFILSFDLEFDVLLLTLKRLFKFGFDFIETFFEFEKSLLFHHDTLIVLLQAISKV